MENVEKWNLEDFYLICFHDQCSDFVAYTSLCLIHGKNCKICDKIISIEKYEKLRNSLCKMKN